MKMVNDYKGTLSNSTIYSDDKGDYIVPSRDVNGVEFKVYITSKKTK